MRHRIGTIALVTLAIGAGVLAAFFVKNGGEVRIFGASPRELREIEGKPKAPTADEVELASIENLDISLYRVGYEPSQARINEVRVNLKCLRDWIGGAPGRQPYMRWVEYYEGEADDAQRELSTGADKEEQEAYNRESEREQERDKAIAKTLPVPPREAMVCARDGERK